MLAFFFWAFLWLNFAPETTVGLSFSGLRQVLSQNFLEVFSKVGFFGWHHSLMCQLEKFQVSNDSKVNPKNRGNQATVPFPLTRVVNKSQLHQILFQEKYFFMLAFEHGAATFVSAKVSSRKNFVRGWEMSPPSKLISPQCRNPLVLLLPQSRSRKVAIKHKAPLAWAS